MFVFGLMGRSARSSCEGLGWGGNVHVWVLGARTQQDCDCALFMAVVGVWDVSSHIRFHQVWVRSVAMAGALGFNQRQMKTPSPDAPGLLCHGNMEIFLPAS